MDIVVVGVGKVGKTITEHLVKENHNITLIDAKSEIIRDAVNEFDVRGVVGNGASLDVLMEAEVDKADLLIAATSSDEVNILCSLVAKKIGVSSTIARVRSPEYSKHMSFMTNELGVNMFVNPELDTANEISRILRFPSALKVETFSNGKLELVEMKVASDSVLVGKSLHEIRDKYQIKMLVCAVERNDDVFIPNGDTLLNANDQIYITGNKNEIVRFFKKLGILKEKTKNIMIIGGGRIAYYLSEQLFDSNVTVKIFESDSKRCAELSKIVKKAIVINGNGTDQKLLLEEGIENADALVSLTGFDEINIIISAFASSLNVNKVITKVNSTNYGTILKTVGLDTVISPKDITSNNVIRYVRGMQGTYGSEFKTLYKLVNNKAEALEFYIPAKTSYTSIPLKDLKLKNEVMLAAIIRNNHVIIPSGDDTIEPLDNVIIVTTNTLLKDVKDILK